MSAILSDARSTRAGDTVTVAEWICSGLWYRLMRVRIPSATFWKGRKKQQPIAAADTGILPVSVFYWKQRQRGKKFDVTVDITTERRYFISADVTINITTEPKYLRQVIPVREESRMQISSRFTSALYLSLVTG